MKFLQTAFKPRVKDPPKEIPPHIEWKSVISMFLTEHGNSVENQQKHRDGLVTPSATPIEDERLTHCYRQFVLQLICAERSPQQIPVAVHRIMDSGNARHDGLDTLFNKIVAAGYMGIVKGEPGRKFGQLKHATLPLEGSFDYRVTTAAGHRYILEFKTIGTRQADILNYTHGIFPPKTRGGTDFKPSKQELRDMEVKMLGYRVQLNTYLGLAGDKVGYLVLEENNVYYVLDPMREFRVEYDHDLFMQVEDFVRAMVAWVQAEMLPEYEEARCSPNLTFCPFTASCRKATEGVSFQELDRRTPEMRRRHLEVIT